MNIIFILIIILQRPKLFFVCLGLFEDGRSIEARDKITNLRKLLYDTVGGIRRRSGGGLRYRLIAAQGGGGCTIINQTRQKLSSALTAFHILPLSRFLQLLVPVARREVLTKMGSNNSQIDEKIPVAPPAKVTFCQRKKSENGSFVGTLRNRFHEFIHASMDEHRTCLRNTIQKIFGKKSDSPNENEISLPLQSTTKD